MLHEFLLRHEKEILALTEKKTLQMAGARPSSDQLKKGLPIFYEQLLTVLKREESNLTQTKKAHPQDEALTTEAGLHGGELLRLGYTLSHVVHAYGSMCQAITEFAVTKKTAITVEEFHDLNRCLDVAIAGAVTSYQELRNTQVSNKEVEHLGCLAHELRNALGTVKMSLDLIKDGTVGFNGSTGQILERGLKCMDELIASSLIEVRLRIEPEVNLENMNLLLLIDQIFVTAEIEAKAQKQILETQINSDLFVQGDRQLIYSAVSNLIQNALKFTHIGGRIQVRAHAEGGFAVIEVQDECGGLKDSTVNLFKAFEQKNENRTGLGLGLTIAQRAVKLNHGSINVTNLPGSGCIFKIILPLADANLGFVENPNLIRNEIESKTVHH